MPLLNKQFPVYLLVVWFALLQAMAPFVHQHVGNALENGKQSFHIHELESANPTNLTHQTRAIPTEGYIVSLDEVILSKHKAFSADISADLWILACFAFVLLPLSSRVLPKPKEKVLFNLQFQHSPHSPRAPPLV
jgi:hypothetical protein